MGTLIFYQANEHSAWTLLPLLRRKPLDSNDLRSGSRRQKSEKGHPYWERGGCRLRSRRASTLDADIAALSSCLGEPGLAPGCLQIPESNAIRYHSRGLPNLDSDDSGVPKSCQGKSGPICTKSRGNVVQNVYILWCTFKFPTLYGSRGASAFPCLSSQGVGARLQAPKRSENGRSRASTP
jgi:hypothetical protein